LLNRVIDLEIRPRFWSKNKFKIGISEPALSGNISTGEYQDIAKEGINLWETALHNFATTNNQHNHLSEIEFDIHNGLLVDDDVQVLWWASHVSNGLTVPNNRNGEISFAKVLISQQKLVQTSLGTDNFLEPGEVHNRDQIRSIATHEFGHVLNLGHCNFDRDLMFTCGIGMPGPTQPDPSRVISNLDLEVISDTFRPGYQPPQTDSIRKMNRSEWQSV